MISISIMCQWIMAFMLMSVLSTGLGKPSFESSAVCIAKGNKCTAVLSYQSEVCTKHTYISRQPIACIRMACRFCLWKSSRGHRACKSWGIKTWCPRFHVYNPDALHRIEMEKRSGTLTIESRSGPDESVGAWSLMSKVKRFCGKWFMA